MDRNDGRQRPRWRSGEGGCTDRRMLLLKRAGLFSSDTKGARITRATGPEDLAAAYRLVHDVFLERGYIEPDQKGIRLRVFEALPETATFVAKAAAEVVGVTSVVVDSPDLGLPSDKAFKVEIDALRSAGRKICEGTNWLVAESHRRTAVMSELMRCSFAHAMMQGCADFIGAVSPGHAGFYGLLGFEQLGGVRSYSSQIDDPVVVVRLDLTGLADRFRNIDQSSNEAECFLKRYYLDENPYGRHVVTWQILSDRFFADPISLRELFVAGSSLPSRCDQKELRAIESRWGQAIFAEAWGRQSVPPAGAVARAT
jgi:hypothetical protein